VTEVLTEADDGVLLITLNRPEARNAVNAAVARGVAAALDRLDGDDELQAGILTGAGKGVCAGMDLKAFVAARGARLAIPEVKRGLMAAGGGLIRLPRRIPYHVAMELALTGDPIDAERAHAIGLVNRLAEPGGALAAARELAAAVAANGPLAVAGSKRIVAAAGDWGEAEAWERQADISEPVFASEDAREGASAFAEKRAPVWKGR
jgi:enoyl-CoA hydratase